MRIFEVMSERVQTIGPDESAERVWDLMNAKGLKHLVVKDGTAVVGIFSDSDAGGRSGAAIRSGKTVRQLMDPHVIAVSRDDTVRKAANVMAGHRSGCLPVIHHGKLVGVVTVADMLKVIGRGIDRPNHESRAPTHYRVPHRKNGAAGRW
jgi:acetoin utilization protein AcuB